MLSKILYGTKNVLIFYAGPTIHGFEIFDKHCHFGNEVEMTKENLDHLKKQVLDYKPTIPYYVCKMGKTTNNITRGKMVIPKTPTYKTLFSYTNCITYDVLAEPTCITNFITVFRYLNVY
jgi:hypothetical protein